MTAVPEPNERPPTLGELMSEVGLQLQERHLTGFAWATAFTPVRRRLEQLDQSWAERFRRVEDAGTGALPRLATVRGLPDPAGAHGGRGPASASTTATEPLPTVPPTTLPPTGDATPVPAPGHVPDPAPGRPDSVTAPALPHDVRARLRDLAGPGAERMQVRTGPEADAVARAHSADAVTLGTQVHLRAGRYLPGTPGGFALLAHEARHVTALLGRGEAADRATATGPAAEERAAREIEQKGLLAARRPRPAQPGHQVARSSSLHQPSIGNWPSSGIGPPATASVATARAMAAPVDRSPDTDPAAPALDLEGLRRSLIDDIMRRLHSDFERGA